MKVRPGAVKWLRKLQGLLLVIWMLSAAYGFGGKARLASEYPAIASDVISLRIFRFDYATMPSLAFWYIVSNYSFLLSLTAIIILQRMIDSNK